ncbi:MAG TPA: Mur ligase family protein [Patescibacteria group bacterium]|nr:Mur ligase family protein [Patescibacteria group bacterium]
MNNAGYFKNKKITVIGLARSGLACANLLDELGAQVSVTDNKDGEEARRNAAGLRSARIACELGRHTPGSIVGRDMVVISPGVPDSSQAVLLAQQNKIPIISEIEVAYLLCPATLIAVTGSNGKTTVTTLIGKVIEASGKRCFVCGNIGNPFCGEVRKMNEGDFVSLEVSSFQLEHIEKFKPKVAVILNFSCNHLDRYRTMQEYLDAKKRIFMNQDRQDYLVLSHRDDTLKGIAAEAKSQVVFFAQDPAANPNYDAVMSVASILGIEAQVCRRVFDDFRGIEHRMEYVGQINEVKFINDSKATTVESARWALERINEPVILIAGGRHKGIDYSGILAHAAKKVKAVILIGEAKKKIADALAGKVPLEETDTLEEAVHRAFAKASPGDCVLLSPMCSSFDMFSSYEERGRVFKDIVGRLIRSTH